MVDLSQSTWLADLVDAEIAAWDPATARLKLPPELRSSDPDRPSPEAQARALLVRAVRPRAAAPALADPVELFLGPLRQHVELVLDIALVLERAHDPGRRRAELAMLFAAAVGATDDAIAADPAHVHRRSPAAVRRAFAIAAGAFVERSWPPGDARDGLALRSGVIAIERRHLGRLAIDYHRRGHLEEPPVRRRLAQARREAMVLFEAHVAAAAPLTRSSVKAALGQLGQLELPRRMRQRARAALGNPATPDGLAALVHPRLRPFVLEQLLIGVAASGALPARVEFVERFAGACGVCGAELATMQAEAAILHAASPPPFAAVVRATPTDSEYQFPAEDIAERIATVVAENFEALVKELKETGELGQLLARAAAGHTLTLEERAKVKAQLIDVAKAVPALAIFAAPGGMLLLPLLAKVLPFSMLPSSWDGPKKTPLPALPPAPAAAPAPVAEAAPERSGTDG